ncbi:MAG: hypothetical protein ABJE95_32995 [Byssovorax sp.]
MKPIAILALILGAALLAAPARANDSDKNEARALFDEGNKLIQKGDFEGALQRFRYAYERFPSVKILLNTATVLKELRRNADAANTYQRYLRSPESDPARRDEIAKILVALDAKVGKLRIELDDPQLRVRLDGKLESEPGDWLCVRVEPGTATVVGEKDGFPAVTREIGIGAGESRTVRLGKPDAPRNASPAAVIPPADAPAPTPVEVSRAPVFLSHAWQPGLFTRLDIEGRGRGVLGVVGVSYGIGTSLEMHVAALIGREKGLEPGITVLLLAGSLKPRIALALPIFLHGGAYVGFRPAVGLSWDPSRHLGFFVEAAGAFFPSVPVGHESVVFVPALGVQGRL